MKTLLEIVTGLYLTSEALSLIPFFKANGTFQMIFYVIKDVYFWVKK
jgi:hypothetical protein